MNKRIMKWYIILIILKYILLLIPISILVNNGFILEGGFLVLYVFIEILSTRVRRIEEKINELEVNLNGN